MSTHYRELEARFNGFLGTPDFSSSVSNEAVQGVRDLFRRRTVFVSTETGGLSEVHEMDAVLRVSNAVLATKGGSGDNIDELVDGEEVRLAWKFLAAASEDAKVLQLVDREVSQKAIEYHYATIRPRLFDIFVHLSGSDMFFIDGDSLLMAALSSPHVDWDLTQTLHVHHNAQSLLYRLQSRGARFHVVFFEQQRWFWEKAPQKLLMRESLRLVLEEVATSNPQCGFRVETFKNFADPAFLQHVEAYDPEFILMSDGEQLGEPTWLQSIYHNTEADVEQDEFKSTYRSLVDDEKLGNDVAFYYRCFHLWAQAKRMKVAYSTRIVIRENAVIVFTASVRSAHFSRALLLEHAASEFACALERDVVLPSVPSRAVEICQKEADLYFREKVVAGAVYAFLHRGSGAVSEEERELCLALLVTAYTMVYFDLPERAQRRTTSPGVAAFLNTISPYLVQVFPQSREFWTGVEFDLLDGHLLCAVALNLQQHSVAELLGSRLLEDVEIAWVDVLGESKELLMKPLGALPEHDLVTELSKRLDVAVPPNARVIASGNGNAENLHGWKIVDSFLELNDVVDRQAEEKKQKTMTDRRRRREEELEAQFKKDAQDQAKSMGLTNFTNERLELVAANADQDRGTRQKKEHMGQHNKKGTAKKDDINFINFIQTASDAAVKFDSRVRQLCNNVNRAKGIEGPIGDELLSQLQNSLAELRSTKFESNFDPGANLEEDKQKVPLKLAVWRMLVARLSDGGNEALFLSKIVEPTNAPLAKGSKKNALAFVNMVDGVDPTCAEMVRLENVVNHTKSYMYWVMLSYLRVHLCAKLMCGILKLYLAKWRSEREIARNESRTPNIDIGIPMFIWSHHRVLACVRDTGIKLSTDDMNTVRSALAHLDFPGEYYTKLERFIAEWQGAPVEPLGVSLQPRDKVWTETPERTQLLHMGHKLERPVIMAKDYRVGFNPDAWQRELLDIVDKRASAVVCAPTSAGKTFISYYCMLKALRTSNKRMVAYVAPTRALINQAVVDVCARYGSKKYNEPGMNVYGILGGGDYHRYHNNCQVIITLPEVLETLLLSPAYRDVAERLDYVILDEIHTMESSGNGDVWERVLSLLPCPFVALSATLGQTERLCSWLNRVQDRLRVQDGEQAERDYRVYNVPSSGEPIQRYNDIKKYIYLPPSDHKPSFRKISSEYKNRFIKDLHPLSILTIDQIRFGFPPDISLVPSEVVQLYEAMLREFEQIRERWPRVIKVLHMEKRLKELKPEEYFKDFVCWVNLTRETEIGAAEDQKRVPLGDEELHAFQADMNARCSAVLQSFSLQLRQEETQLNEKAIQAVKQELAGEAAPNVDAASLFPDSKQFIATNIINVLRELGSRSMGPTIVFSFESQDCDDLVRAVVEQLEAAEYEYRKTDEYRAMEEQRKAQVRRAREKIREMESMKKMKLSKDEDGDAMRNDRGGPEDNFADDLIEETEPDVLEEFTFLRKHMNRTVGSDVPVYEDSMVQKALESCEENGDNLARRAILRGIGIHHAGVKGKIRRDMEVLFRTGYSGVIFATETLALGIHSPCRSVVLAGDHVLLNATQFRQMMGRAGRRGLDDLGHLVFFSVNIKKITRLMTSGITVIKGNVQMDAISLLRLLQLYEHPQHRIFMEKKTGEWSDKRIASWKRYVLDLAERLFVNPLFYAGTDAIEGGNLEALTVSVFRMLLGYFHREGLYNTEKPSALGSLLVDAMHVFRNAGVGAEGFAFMNMLTNGVLAEADFPPEFQFLDSKVHASGRRAEAVAELMAYLFSVQKMCNVPLEIHRSVLSDPAVVKLWRKSGNPKRHRVVLAPLSLLNPHGIVLDHARAYGVISAFYTWMAKQLKMPPGKRLRYMNSRSMRADPVFGAGAGTESFPLKEHLQKTAVEYAARDPLVAISGCGDSFVNLEDLSTTLREGLFCDPRMLPLYDFTDGCRHDGAQVLINACLSDFIRCQAERDPLRARTFRFAQLERLNGLSQSESYAVLNHAEVVLGNIAGPNGAYDVIQRLYPEEDEEPYLAGADLVVEMLEQRCPHNNPFIIPFNKDSEEKQNNLTIT
eukprot:gene6046-4347_t